MLLLPFVNVFYRLVSIDRPSVHVYVLNFSIVMMSASVTLAPIRYFHLPVGDDATGRLPMIWLRKCKP
jgi:hypothetical protein